MKFRDKLVVFTGASVQTSHAAMFQTTPMARVASLLTEMKSRIESDGRVEQQSYDKYACWCEDTMGRKANDISENKKSFASLEVLILKLQGEIGAHQEEIKQLDKDIASNKASQGEASSIRKKDSAAYQDERGESEQCSGALEAAIRVMNGAGTGKGFLETLKEAQLLSVMAEVRGVVERPSVKQRLNSKDLLLVSQFVAHPQDFVSGHGGFLSATQTSNNPFGDYAPQSSQITGILKGMYDTFLTDLEKANHAEATSQKSHEELMGTKLQELSTLEATLRQQKVDLGTKSTDLAESSQRRDETKEQINTDENLFDSVKSGCKDKAGTWAERVRLRTQELAGVGQAIGILTDQESLQVFTNSTTTFLQVASIHKTNDRHMEAFAKVASLAQRFHSYGLAQLAVALRAGGHFDKVIGSVDQMIANLREEEQEDIVHRDRCQRADGKNTNDMQDINSAMTKLNSTELQLQGDEGKLQGEVDTLTGDINATKLQIASALDTRNEGVSDFRQALEDDIQAVALLEQAIATLARFYRANNIPMTLISKATTEKSAPTPEYTVDPDKAPATAWEGSYEGAKSESHGIVFILEMIKEDVEKEIITLRKDNAKSQQQYDQEKAAMEEALQSQLAVKVDTEGDLIGTQKQLLDLTKEKAEKGRRLQSEVNLQNALVGDCSWVATHFDSRRTKRKTEIQGLVDAKGFLAGVESGI